MKLFLSIFLNQFIIHISRGLFHWFRTAVVNTITRPWNWFSVINKCQVHVLILAHRLIYWMFWLIFFMFLGATIFTVCLISINPWIILKVNHEMSQVLVYVCLISSHGLLLNDMLLGATAVTYSFPLTFVRELSWLLLLT